MDTKMQIEIEALSPISLGSGQGDVVVDSEIIHDELGIPYFPAKRLKGLLYESAMECADMLTVFPNGQQYEAAVQETFGHCKTAVQCIVHNFYIQDYEKIAKELKAVEEAFPACVQPTDVLEEYTSLRYQTAIDENGIAKDTVIDENDSAKDTAVDKNGIAKDHSLRNIRVVNEHILFTGEIGLLQAEQIHIDMLTLALKNLQYAGMKRNRGFGHIECRIRHQDMNQLVQQILRKAAQ